MNQDLMIGRQLANFRIERVLGHGGMGTVYYGQDIKLQRPVAIKVIDSGHQEKTSYIERFVQEARALAGWRHENIIQIHYADDENGLYYFVMEYIEGQNLQQILAEYTSNGELVEIEDVLRIGDAIGSALDFAHEHGVIHRDVKPSNIFVERSGQIVLGDFGLALDIQQGSVGETFGSVHYIAPEQAQRSSDAVPESDLYSMGIILYEMLTGILPFDDPSPTSVAVQQITLSPPPPRQINPDLNEQVEAVLLKILSKSPGERYHSGSEFMAALKDALEAAPISTAGKIELPPQPPGLPSPHGSFVRTYSQVSIAQTVQKNLDARPAQAQPEPTQVTPIPPDLSAGGTRAKPATSRRIFLVVGLITGCLLVVIAVGFALSTVFINRMVGTDQPNQVIQGSQFTSSPPAISTEGSVSNLTAIPAEDNPNKQRFILYYDANSFYILQVTGDETPVSPISFERLDKMDVPPNRFSGQQWAKYYGTIKPGVCMRLEIIDSSPYLRPPECNNQYVSTRTPSRNDPGIFWTPAEGSEQFRVNWENEEVARCEINAGICEIYLP